jgi:hypothetical protein
MVRDHTVITAGSNRSQIDRSAVARDELLALRTTGNIDALLHNILIRNTNAVLVIDKRLLQWLSLLKRISS